MDNHESVDFDFFETPRNSVSPPKSPSKQPVGKPPCAPKHDRTGDDVKAKSDDYSSGESYSTDSDERHVVKQAPVGMGHAGSKEGNSKDRNANFSDTDSESSSAYSNSDYSSDSYEEKTSPKKEIIQVKIPKVQAWDEETKMNERDDYDKYQRSRPNEKRSPRDGRGNKRGNRSRNARRNSSSTESLSESDSSHGRHNSKRAEKPKPTDRIQSAKTRGKKQDSRRNIKSTSSSHSNNSDITDVSPLDSPEASPRDKRRSKKSEKRNGGHHVQYSDDTYSPERDPDIKLDSDKIDLSILMKCMADIDKEKQQRLKTNSRRVMFAPPKERSKQNYSFTMDRAKMIEKENQRLLSQIMHHINPGKPKQSASSSSAVSATTRGPKKAVQPVIHRITPSAVNRQKEQRRIESENMHILHRLSTIKPTPGLSRTDQLKEFERTASYGAPGKTMIVSGDAGARYHASRQDMHSSMGGSMRSRPSSAKSNASSVPGGRRLRPSSAKSDVSLRSNASVRSMRSTASKGSMMSMRSNVSAMSGAYVRKMSDGRVDKRPLWDDRFTVS